MFEQDTLNIKQLLVSVIYIIWRKLEESTGQNKKNSSGLQKYYWPIAYMGWTYIRVLCNTIKNYLQDKRTYLNCILNIANGTLVSPVVDKLEDWDWWSPTGASQLKDGIPVHRKVFFAAVPTDPNVPTAKISLLYICELHSKRKKHQVLWYKHDLRLMLLPMYQSRCQFGLGTIHTEMQGNQSKE